MSRKNSGRGRKRLAALLAALAFSAAALPALPAAAEEGYWNETDAGWRYLTGKNDRPVAGRFAFIDGKWYSFDQDGIMQTGWVKIPNSEVWFYFTGSGAAVVNDWQKVGDKWYYFDEAGYMVTGWQEVDGTWYYFYENGALKTGWLMRSSKWYYLNDNGVMQTGWLLDDGKWYYLQIDGSMAHDCTLDIDGVEYSFDPNGVWWVSGEATEEEIEAVTPDTPENAADMDEMESDPEPAQTVPEQLLGPMVQAVASACRHRPAPSEAVTGGYLQSTLVLDREMIADFAGVQDGGDLYLVLEPAEGRENDLITQLNIARRTLLSGVQGHVSKVWSAGGHIALVILDDRCHDAAEELELAVCAFDRMAADVNAAAGEAGDLPEEGETAPETGEEPANSGSADGNAAGSDGSETAGTAEPPEEL